MLAGSLGKTKNSFTHTTTYNTHSTHTQITERQTDGGVTILSIYQLSSEFYLSE